MIDLEKLRAKLPSPCHPYTNMVVGEAETLQIQLSIALDKRSANVEKDIHDDFFGAEDKESKLRALWRHSRDNFKELEHLLNKGVYRPFCFVFHSNTNSSPTTFILGWPESNGEVPLEIQRYGL